jgi:hypothetical protein
MKKLVIVLSYLPCILSIFLPLARQEVTKTKNYIDRIIFLIIKEKTRGSYLPDTSNQNRFAWGDLGRKSGDTHVQFI